MATHRSLNKLEFKAHMSIHNVAAVNDPEPRDTRYTRDRFGKRQSLVGDDVFRLFAARSAAAILAGLFFSAADPFAAWAGTGTNIRVSSEDLGDLSFNDRLGQPARSEKMIFYREGETTAGFNENGEPAVSLPF